jgi:hypothetical protein
MQMSPNLTLNLNTCHFANAIATKTIIEIEYKNLKKKTANGN